jgi:ribosome production factor 1
MKMMEEEEQPELQHEEPPVKKMTIEGQPPAVALEDAEVEVKVKKAVEVVPIGNISEIGNRELRHKSYVKLKRDKKKDKKKRREERKKVADALGDDAPPKEVPKTIENMREADETTVASAEAPEEEQDEEVTWDIANDEFKDYFSKSYEPKILITTGDNPHTVSQSRLWKILNQ